MDYLSEPDTLAANHGTSPIGTNQRTIAFTVVASGGTGLLNITAAAHKLKKGSQFYIAAGAYAGYYRVKKVISANVIQVEGTFGSTTTGNLLLTGAIDGFGFYVDEAPVTIDELVADNSNVDVDAFIATEFLAGTWYPFPFKKIRISAGNITCVRKPVPTILPYSNR